MYGEQLVQCLDTQKVLHKKQQTLEISSLSFIQLGRAFLGFKMGVSRIPSGETGKPTQISLKENITFIYHSYPLCQTYRLFLLFFKLPKWKEASP